MSVVNTQLIRKNLIRQALKLINQIFPLANEKNILTDGFYMGAFMAFLETYKQKQNPNEETVNVINDILRQINKA